MIIQNTPAGTIRAALRYPAFRWLLSALAVSQVGDWLYNLVDVASIRIWLQDPVPDLRDTAQRGCAPARRAMRALTAETRASSRRDLR
jgi:hypothetical protein